MLKAKKRTSSELGELEQIVFRLDDIKSDSGNCVIKRDTRRCHVAVLDNSELTKTKEDLDNEKTAYANDKSKWIENENILKLDISNLQNQLNEMERERANVGKKIDQMIKYCSVSKLKYFFDLPRGHFDFL